MNVVQKSNLKACSKYYPFLRSDSFLEKRFYNGFKEEALNIFEDSNYKVTSDGQDNRKNITINKNKNYKNFDYAKKNNSHLYQFYNALDSYDFRVYLYEKFADFLSQNGYLGSHIKGFMESELDLQICQASANYENPFHVDTRRRVIHGLLYFGKENLIGGELLLGKHKKRNLLDYRQIPLIEDIEETTSVDPEDNAGLLILSTPNSYHKGQCGEGIRRFCYWGYNYQNNDNCWIAHPSWDKPMKFNKETLNYQKNVIYKNHSTSSNLNEHNDNLNQIDDNNSIEKKAKLKFKEKNIDIQKNFESNVSKNIFADNNSFLLSIISELELKVKKLNQEILGLRSEFRK